MANNLFQGGQQPPRANINVKLEDLADVKCDECEGEYFRMVMMMKRLSPLVSPSGQEQMVPIQIFRCDDCGHVNEVFLPK
jgi:predicted nucleic acid-binding Zn ribbon protein